MFYAHIQSSNLRQTTKFYFIILKSDEVMPYYVCICLWRILRGSCYECWCKTLSRLSTASAVAHPYMTALLLRACSKDGRLTGYIQSRTYIDPWAAQGLEAGQVVHITLGSGPWFEFIMEAGKRPRIVQAAHGDDYAPVWGTPMRMMTLMSCAHPENFPFSQRIYHKTKNFWYLTTNKCLKCTNCWDVTVAKTAKHIQ